MPDSTPTTPPDRELSLPDLESELLGLAGHIAAAECRFLRLLAEFDDRGGWCGVGVRSCAHWLTWRAGMSLRTATEHLRVAHALTRLPRITEAFAAGRISYSKVRAVTRVVGADDAVLDRMTALSCPGPATQPVPSPGSTPGAGTTAEATGTPAGGEDTGPRDDTGPGPVAAPQPDGAAEPDVAPRAAAAPDAEQVLLDLALGGTASHVETVVRAVRRRCAPPRDVAARRGVSWYHDVDGSLVVRGRFTPEDGALLVAAIGSRVAAARPAPAGPVMPSTDDSDDPDEDPDGGRAHRGRGTGPIRTRRPGARRSRRPGRSSTPWPPGGPTRCWTWLSMSPTRRARRWWSGARRR